MLLFEKHRILTLPLDLLCLTQAEKDAAIQIVNFLEPNLYARRLTNAFNEFKLI